jgi:sterol desaturase/sphingolipid hydroxylase (fatty acid hydroxylase superfamily)
MPFTTPQIVVLVLIATLGHVMALLGYLAVKCRFKVCDRLVYDLPIESAQLRREFRNSLHSPMPAIMLAGVLYLGYFQNDTWLSFAATLVLTFLWVEIWHYVTHRAYHLKSLHWIHAEHHKSHLNSWLTALSFSFTEQFIFDVGILAPLMALDHFVGVNFYGVAGYFLGYLVINSLHHANYEIKSDRYNRWFGQVFTTTTYHSLHHSRYIKNYGLGTRVLDRMLGTEWTDYEPVYDRITHDLRPLTKLGEKLDTTSTSSSP